jgi:dephospho-CoA kinase
MFHTAVLGLLGGIGSGKSTVAAFLSEQGAIVLDADAIAHDLLTDPSIITEVTAAFGRDVMSTNGSVDRAALGSIVFSDISSNKLSVLEEIIHPRVRQVILDELARAKRINHPLVVLDIPLLLESPLLQECHRLLFVDTSRKNRLERVAMRDWDESEFNRREALQASLELKEERADDTVLNNGQPEETRAWIEEFYHRLTNEMVGDSNGQDSQENEEDDL